MAGERRTHIEKQFPPEHVEAATMLMELAGFAWHDRFGGASLEFPDNVFEDVLGQAEGDIVELIRAIRIAISDFGGDPGAATG